MIFRREKYLDKIYSSLKKEKLVILLGTRQVGKTTLLQILRNELGGDIYYYSFEDDFSKIEFMTKADFIDYFRLSLGIDFKKEGIFLIDEFQYVKNGEKILKSLYDDKEILLKFVVTGSGLWTYGTDNKGTLVGRWDEIFVYSFDFFEFLEAKLDISKNFSSFSKKLSLFPGYILFLLINSKNILFSQNFTFQMSECWILSKNPSIIEKIMGKL